MMGHEHERRRREHGDSTVEVRSAAALRRLVTRRDFMRLMGLGGALIILPSVLWSCQDGENTGGITAPGSGQRISIDFSKGDVAVLQFAYALELLEADFYTQVVNNFPGSSFSSAEQAIITDIRNHEIAHREYLKAVLAADATFSLTPLYPGLNFQDRTAVLDAARTFEDLGVAAYNGAAQFLADGGNLLAAAKIVSVEARHASAIRAMISPLTGDFAPKPFDDALQPATVTARAAAFLTERLSLASVPDSFVQGPNANG